MAKAEEATTNNGTGHPAGAGKLTPINNDPRYKGLYTVNTFEDFFRIRGNGNGNGDKQDDQRERRG